MEPPHPRDPSTRRRIVVGVLAALALGLVLMSPAFGRSEPTGNYRPVLPPDALSNGCWSLPGDVRLDFGYQVRSDDLVATVEGSRRMLVLHYDEISGAEATQRVQAAFADAGVTGVAIAATDFTDTAPEAVVRGRLLLDLPPSEPEGRPECQQPFSTKNFPPSMDDRS